MEHASPSEAATGDGATFRSVSGWRAARHALLCRHGDTATLLSTRSWAYFGLNATACTAWAALTGGQSVSEVARSLATTCGVPLDAVLADVDRLVVTLERLQFLTRDDEPTPAHRQWTPPRRRASAWRPPTRLACTEALLWAGVRLRTSTLDPESWLAASPDDDAPVLSVADADRATGELRRAAPWLPAKTYCLLQSVALVRVLRQRGVDARLRLGARPYPFVAHAWVESGRLAVNETDEQLAMYAPFEPARGAR